MCPSTIVNPILLYRLSRSSRPYQQLETRQHQLRFTSGEGASFIHDARFEVLSVVLLSIQVFLDLILIRYQLFPALPSVQTQ